MSSWSWWSHTGLGGWTQPIAFSDLQYMIQQLPPWLQTLNFLQLSPANTSLKKLCLALCMDFRSWKQPEKTLRDNHHLRSHPHTPGRYPGRFTNSLWRNWFFLCGGERRSFGGIFPGAPVGKNHATSWTFAEIHFSHCYGAFTNHHQLRWMFMYLFFGCGSAQGSHLIHPPTKMSVITKIMTFLVRNPYLVGGFNPVEKY